MHFRLLPRVFIDWFQLVTVNNILTILWGSYFSKLIDEYYVSGGARGSGRERAMGDVCAAARAVWERVNFQPLTSNPEPYTLQSRT